jgi:hypothetical protein
LTGADIVIDFLAMLALILTIAGLVLAGVGIEVTVSVGASGRNVGRVSKDAASLRGDREEWWST